ncbi:hypothetical protein [Kaistia soli]|nr:hypothetical protein [Kaistia soli]
MRALNPWAGGLWRRALMKAFEQERSSLPTIAITLYSEQWSFALEGASRPPVLEDMLVAMESDVSAALEGLSYLLLVDVAIHRTSRGRQQTLCYHLHGVAWGTKAEIKARLKGWGSGFMGAPGHKLVDIFDLKGWIDYSAKDTRCRYVTNPVRAPLGRETHHHHRERLWGPQLGTLLGVYGDLRKPQLALAGGIGAKILKSARAVATQRAREIDPDCQIEF